MGSSDDEAPVGMPRWVKIFALIAFIVLAAFAILHIVGIAPHGHG